MQVYSPKTLDDALAHLANKGNELTLLCGGTDLMVFLEMGAIKPEHILDIWGVPELRGIREENDVIVIGASTSYTQIIESPVVQQWAPTLVESARLVGALQIQNRGTLGGNLGNASPAADTPPVLLASGASVTLISTSGQRTVHMDDFFVGYRAIDRQPNELIYEIRIPKQQPHHHDFFHKVGTRRAQSISKVVMGARAHRASDGTLDTVRIAVGSVAATTTRMPKTEQVMVGRQPDQALLADAVAAARAEVVPIDDIRSTAVYRRQVTGNLVGKWVRALQANR